MAEAIPAALRIPEVSRFLKRANQLRTFNPAVAYWCTFPVLTCSLFPQTSL